MLTFIALQHLIIFTLYFIEKQLWKILQSLKCMQMKKMSAKQAN